MTNKFELNGLPAREVVLELDVADLGGLILAYIRKNSPQKFSSYNYTLNFRDDDEVQLALSEACDWIKHQGLLVQDPGQTDGWYVLSRRGLKVESHADFQSLKLGLLLPRELLHPHILAAITSDFYRGEYDSAVFKAYREIEVAVREACGYDDTLYGRTLMSKAFDPEKGPLRNSSIPDMGERQGLRDLFAGAIGSYKNPHSHRKVAIDPKEACEMIILASHLYSIVQERKKSVQS